MKVDRKPRGGVVTVLYYTVVSTTLSACPVCRHSTQEHPGPKVLLQAGIISVLLLVVHRGGTTRLPSGLWGGVDLYVVLRTSYMHVLWYTCCVTSVS